MKANYKRNISYLLLILILGILFSCAHRINTKGMSITQKMRVADKLFANEHYNQARDVYEEITFEAKGDTLIQKAQFRLAESYFELNLFQDAIYEYEEILRLYPLSKYARRSLFKLGKAYYNLSNPPAYDQQETRRALEYFERYMNRYPNSEELEDVENMLFECKNKLLEKKYLNGRIYYKMGYNNAALMYLNEILEQRFKSEVDKKATILAAKVYNEQKDWDSLQKIQQRLQDKYPENQYINIIEEQLTEKE